MKTKHIVSMLLVSLLIITIPCTSANGITGDKSDYGGMYINKNNELIVYVLPDQDKTISVASSDEVLYKQADYSLKQLTDEMDRIYAYMDKNDIDCEMSLDESANRIAISLPSEEILRDISSDIGMFHITIKENEYRRVKCACDIV
ncbi:MAG: hypothetical protein ACI4W6_07235 [Acutalibacteraceae bacterium]